MWAGVWQSVLQELPKHGHGGDDRREKVYCLLGKKVQPKVYIYIHTPHMLLSFKFINGGHFQE